MRKSQRFLERTLGKLISLDSCSCVWSDLVRTYTQDGVCLTESGLCQLQSLSAAAARRRKPKPKLKLKIINQNSVAVLQGPGELPSEQARHEDTDDHRGAFNTNTHPRQTSGRLDWKCTLHDIEGERSLFSIEPPSL